MAEFEAITTQEQLDGILKDRLARKDAQHEKAMADVQAKLSDYESLQGKATEYEKQIAELTKSLADGEEKAKGFDAQIAEKDKQIKEFELRAIKMQTAIDLGIPSDAIGYIQGDDEETIRKSAEGLKSLVCRNNFVQPMANTENIQNAEDGVTAAFRALNPGIKL